MEEPQRMARYLYTFVVMARKGFYSFAPITPDVTDGDYYLMAKPRNYEDRAFEGIVEREIEYLNFEDLDSFTPVGLVRLLNNMR